MSVVDILSAKRVVIKIGSALLVEAGAVRTAWLDGLAADIADNATDLPVRVPPTLGGNQ